jgi:hypothetical protein
MSTRIVNVRLDEGRLRKVEALRKKGVVLSEVVRAAIDERYEQLVSSRRRRDVPAMLARLDAEYPVTADDFLPPKYDVHDRRSAAAAIRRRLERKRANPRRR